MQHIVLGNGRYGRSEFAQNAGEEAEVDMHVNRLANVFGARPLENQREAGRIQMASNREVDSNVPT